MTKDQTRTPTLVKQRGLSNRATYRPVIWTVSRVNPLPAPTKTLVVGQERSVRSEKGQGEIPDPSFLLAA